MISLLKMILPKNVSEKAVSDSHLCILNILVDFIRVESINKFTN